MEEFVNLVSREHLIIGGIVFILSYIFIRKEKDIVRDTLDLLFIIILPITLIYLLYHFLM